MTIQRKPPIDPSVATISGDNVASSGKVERPFAERLGETKAASNVGGTERTSANEDVTGSSPLERLRRGEIDVEGYAHAKIEEATRGLQHLAPNDLGTIRELLREKLLSDPDLVELVTKATGSALPEHE